MIKVKTVESHLYDSVDADMTKFFKDEGIKREDIIHLQFYSARGEDGWLYHYGKLVYEIEEENSLIWPGDEKYV